MLFNLPGVSNSVIKAIKLLLIKVLVPGLLSGLNGGADPSGQKCNQHNFNLGF